MSKEAVIQQGSNRKEWGGTDSALSIAKLLRAEVDELIEAIELAEIGAGVYEVASEMGDVTYLLNRLENLTGINADEACEMKTLRNGFKYGDAVFLNGWDYEESASKAKKFWKELSGEEIFSRAYLEYLSE